MQTIIYTSPTNIENEIEIISQLLDNGADYLYIRKPELDDYSLVDFVESIPEKYWKQCVTNSMIITKEFDLAGYHFTRGIVQKNGLYNDKVLDWLHSNNKISSVSAHSIEDIKSYAGKFKHIIVSPMFPSISKENHSYDWNMEELKIKIAELRFKSKLFAVGGIDIDKIATVKDIGFDGVGLLGALWKEPENTVTKYQQIKNY